jgi:hypothetical protein
MAPGVADCTFLFDIYAQNCNATCTKAMGVRGVAFCYHFSQKSYKINYPLGLDVSFDAFQSFAASSKFAKKIE